CLHFLMIIMDSFLGQHNPSNYFALTEKERTYRGFNSFDSRDLSVLEAISKGEYMTFGIQGKQIRQHLPKITPSAMTRIFKRLKVHGLIEKIPGSY
ncbi:MarR family transcriptional regulator, partial [Thomasclavelia ramosa]|uniref:MarR family transcriptional regulator n=1 Tax=Thomasclavelia ramosa TaxID=1547 RepID=UPI001D01B646